MINGRGRHNVGDITPISFLDKRLFNLTQVERGSGGVIIKADDFCPVGFASHSPGRRGV